MSKSEDAIYAFFELETEAFLWVWSQITKSKAKRIKWDLIPKDKLVSTWNSFAKFGFVRNESAVDDIAIIAIMNVAKIYVITVLAGHTEMSPADYVREKLDDEDEHTPAEEILEDAYDRDFLTDKNGAMLISDFALKKMTDLAVDIIAHKKSEDKLIAIDMLLNLAHQRSDLASWFVEGGSSTLSQLFDRKETT